tara:strand:+ start:364 stop:1170 length:807 start_codon:yes stop_codon:yes gene_type:complete
MISRRLTKNQRAEILEAYRAGENTNVIAEKYSCTTNTVNRTVKNLLSDSEYILLKEKRSKISNKNGRLISNSTIKDQKVDVEQKKSLNSTKDSIIQNDLTGKVNENYYSNENNNIDSLEVEDNFSLENHDYKKQDINKSNQNEENNIEIIAPLISGFDFDEERKISDFEVLNYESLPESVYMIVDKKVELELQPISALPEWSFLPENELQRNAILLFANQRTAKRSCSKNQRVIKIPNTGIFKISKPYLISKGITRLILEDSIIALDD